MACTAVDVELARPRLVSLDTLLGLVALALAGYGLVNVLDGVGTTGGTVGWLLIGVAWLLVFPRMFLGLELGSDGLEVSVVSGARRVPYEDVVDARVVEGTLSLRWGGVKASAYHSGPFRLAGFGDVVAFASCASGRFVLLDRQGEEPVVVSPKDPEAFLERFEDRRRG